MKFYDAQGVQHLAAEALGHHAGADALAGGVDGGGGAGRATAHHQHVEHFLVGELGCVPGSGARIHLGQDLAQFHAAGAEGLAVEVDGGHAHDLALFHFLLEDTAIDHHRFHSWG